MNTLKALAYLSAAGSLALLFPRVANGESVEEYLRAFHENTAQMMERLPSVVDEKGNAQPQGYIDRHSLTARFQARNHQLAFLESGPDDKNNRDAPEALLDPGTPLERNLLTLQNAGLMKGEAGQKPWADSYWPTYKGQIAQRYADPASPNSKAWEANYAYSQNSPASGIVTAGDLSRINRLSPAEKYDFVMGDPDWTLTNFSWAQGKNRSEEDGGVASWMGICHGWAGAAHMGAPFVEKPVVVMAQSGIPVTFFPQDIKALQSMLWANGSPSARFVGSRCSVSNPPRNANGRILDQACFDTSPSTWHLAVANQLARNRRSFVFDGTYDLQVWNFPLVSASYSYFNPQTFEETRNLQHARVRTERFKVDKFKEFRPAAARYVVGVFMDVTHVIEIEPGVSRVFDAPTKTVRFIYDLELDENNNVLGGEWYSNAHPDFLWTYDSHAQAMAREENVLLIDPWENRTPVPLHWTAFARRNSARGVPLYAFLRNVILTAGVARQP